MRNFHNFFFIFISKKKTKTSFEFAHFRLFSLRREFLNWNSLGIILLLTKFWKLSYRFSRPHSPLKSCKHERWWVFSTRKTRNLRQMKYWTILPLQRQHERHFLLAPILDLLYQKLMFVYKKFSPLNFLTFDLPHSCLLGFYNSSVKSVFFLLSSSEIFILISISFKEKFRDVKNVYIFRCKWSLNFFPSILFELQRFNCLEFNNWWFNKTEFNTLNLKQRIQSSIHWTQIYWIDGKKNQKGSKRCVSETFDDG